MTRDRSRMVLVSGALESSNPGSELRIYQLAPNMPPGIPQHSCRVLGPNGEFSSPTWSPDGSALAWADARGIWVGQVGDLSGDQCGLSRRLVVHGGTTPDWGPAAPPRRQS
jgi:hypothetical protein